MRTLFSPSKKLADNPSAIAANRGSLTPKRLTKPKIEAPRGLGYRATMPDPQAIKLPAVVFGWKCCGEAGITVLRALGASKWMLVGRCNTCSATVEITKRGVGVLRKETS